MGAFGLILMVVVGSYVWIERERCFYYITFFAGMVYVSNLTKMIYHSPRPYMVSDSVQVFGCSTEFGHPSGHSFTSMIFCIGVLLDRIANYPGDSTCGRIL